LHPHELCSTKIFAVGTCNAARKRRLAFVFVPFPLCALRGLQKCPILVILLLTEFALFLLFWLRGGANSVMFGDKSFVNFQDAGKEECNLLWVAAKNIVGQAAPIRQLCTICNVLSHEDVWE
jgi:hypothetical protein